MNKGDTYIKSSSPIIPCKPLAISSFDFAACIIGNHSLVAAGLWIVASRREVTSVNESELLKVTSWPLKGVIVFDMLVENQSKRCQEHRVHILALNELGHRAALIR